jgi:hypothetical protein
VKIRYTRVMASTTMNKFKEAGEEAEIQWSSGIARRQRESRVERTYQ